MLVARRKDRLAEVADLVRSETGSRVETVVADLADATDLARIEAVLRDDRVTCSSTTQALPATGPLLKSDVDKMSAIIALNTNALTGIGEVPMPNRDVRYSLIAFLPVAPKIEARC